MLKLLATPSDITGFTLNSDITRFTLTSDLVRFTQTFHITGFTRTHTTYQYMVGLFIMDIGKAQKYVYFTL